MKLPVVFFTFNRLDSALKVFEQIKKYKPTTLYIVSDGPRIDFPGEKDAVLNLRQILCDKVTWTCHVYPIFRDSNLGIKSNFNSTLDEVFSREEMAVIIEDDCYPHSDFFQFVEKCFKKYSGNPHVAMVTGNNFAEIAGSEVIFTRHPRIWGWATWRSTWLDYRYETQQSTPILPMMVRTLVSFKSIILLISFLWLLINNRKLDTWDIDFATYFRSKMFLVATPPVNLVENIGLISENRTHNIATGTLDYHPIKPLPANTEYPIVPRVSSRHEALESRRRLRRLVFKLIDRGSSEIVS